MKYMPIIFLSLSFITRTVVSQTNFKLGLENIPDSFLQQLRTSCIGLITNQTGKDQQGNRNMDVLLERGLNITHIFAPEHGLNGTVDAAKEIYNGADQKTNIPVLSLYGNRTGKIISTKSLNNIDVLIFDIQDSGMRHYTYISTLLRTMEAAAEYNKRIVVLDRPNPLGFRMEGPLVEDDLHSFISIASVPLRHGMTVGELAWYFNLYILKTPAKLQVITMHNYDRRMGLNNTLPQPLSPNIQHIQSCYGYSFLGLLGEIEPFDVGVGTPRAFQCILLPATISFAQKKWQELQELLLSYNIKSRPYSHINKKKKQEYAGLALQINDINTLASFPLLLSVLRFFSQAEVPLSYSPMFNKAVGSKTVRKMLEDRLDYNSFIQSIHMQLIHFFNNARNTFLYKPYPHIDVIATY